MDKFLHKSVQFFTELNKNSIKIQSMFYCIGQGSWLKSQDLGPKITTLTSKRNMGGGELCPPHYSPPPPGFSDIPTACSKCLEELKCSITELISLTCWLKQLFSIFSTSIVRERICSSLHFDSPLFDQVSSIYFFNFVHCTAYLQFIFSILVIAQLLVARIWSYPFS